MRDFSSRDNIKNFSAYSAKDELKRALEIVSSMRKVQQQKNTVNHSKVEMPVKEQSQPTEENTVVEKKNIPVQEAKPINKKIETQEEFQKRLAMAEKLSKSEQVLNLDTMSSTDEIMDVVLNELFDES